MSKYRRTNIYLTRNQLVWLREQAERWGIPVAEVIRKAIDRYRHLQETPARVFPIRDTGMLRHNSETAQRLDDRRMNNL